jgi:hypothetical protein
MTWTACPSLEALFTADAGDEELQEHLATCRRCRALRHRLQPTDVETTAQPLEKDAAAGDLSPERTLGSVYAIHGPLSDEYLLGALVDWDEEEAVVVPVSHETRFATNWDLLLDKQLLGYRAVAQVWNHGTVLVEQLNEKIAEFGDWAGALATLYEAAVESRELPTPVPVGPPVLSDADPRLLFQEEEGERAAVYWQPATLLAGVENVFELVRLQRNELGLAADELEVEPTTLEALEGGTLDIGNEIPVPAFGALLRRLELGATRRLEQFVASGVLANYTDRLETRPALARKRRGMRKRPESESRERFAGDYARKVMEELRD